MVTPMAMPAAKPQKRICSGPMGASVSLGATAAGRDCRAVNGCPTGICAPGESTIVGTIREAGIPDSGDCMGVTTEGEAAGAVC